MRTQRLESTSPEAFREVLATLGAPASAAVCCLKGYESRLDPSFTAKALSELGDASVLVWDGSRLKDDSYTSVVPAFLEADSSRLAIAFGRADADHEAMLASWSSMVSASQVYMVLACEESIAWATRELRELGTEQAAASDATLGWLCLRVSSCARVVALGGGQTCLCEARACMALRRRDGAAPTWTPLDVQRSSTEDTVAVWTVPERS